MKVSGRSAVFADGSSAEAALCFYGIAQRKEP